MSTNKISRRSILKTGGLALGALALPFPLTAFTTFNPMTDNNNFDVIIVGGSYAGLSAGMALGRALRKVLIIDSGQPCNRQTPHSHNFLTQDGEKPGAIAEKAREQVLAYDTVKLLRGLAVSGRNTADGFEISTQSGEVLKAGKLIFATGVKDIMPGVAGFAECWGISVIHCPYCHGYEVKHEKTGILANGENAWHYARLVSNLTKELTIFTNGKASFTEEQRDKLARYQIPVVETEIAYLQQEKGHVQQIVFKDNSTFEVKALYCRPDFEQHCKIPEQLGCELTEQGHIRVDMFQKTSIPHIFACGDSTSQMRSVAYAVATGNITGAVVNNVIVEETF